MLHATSCFRALEAVKIANRSSTLPLNVLTMRTSTSASSSASSASSSSSAAASSSSSLSSYSFSATDTSSLMPPNTRASYSVDLRSIHFTPSISCAEHFYFGNSEKNTFCCLCAEDIEPPFTQRMHIAASSRASHTNHTCREVVLDHITLLGMRGYPLDHLYEVWSDVLYSYPIFPRVKELTSPLWCWETRAAALMPYLKWLREMGVLDLCLAAVSPLLGGGGGSSSSTNSSSSSSHTNTEGGIGSSTGGAGSSSSSSSTTSSTSGGSSSGSMSNANSDTYHMRRRVAFERVEYIGDCAWGNNVANRLMLLYPNEQWLYGERVYNFNCMRDAAEMNITLELLFDSLRLAELLPARCIEHVGSGKIKADVVEAVLGELHITVWGLQPEMDDDVAYVEINGENEASLLMVVQHCLTEMYDLLVLGYVRELSGNALPIAKSLAARNIWFETQPFLRHHKSGRQRHWSRHRGSIGGFGMNIVPPTQRPPLTAPSSPVPLVGTAVPSGVTSAASTSSTSSRAASTEEEEEQASAPALSPSPQCIESPLSTPPSSSTHTEEEEGTPSSGAPPEAPEGPETAAGDRGSPPPIVATTSTAPLPSALPPPSFPSLSLVPTSAVGFSRSVEGVLPSSSSPSVGGGAASCMVLATTMATAWSGPRFLLPALPRLHPTRTPYPLSLPHPLLVPLNRPPLCVPHDSDDVVQPSSSSWSSHTSGTADGATAPPPPSEEDTRPEASPIGGDGRGGGVAPPTSRFGRPLAMPGSTAATTSSPPFSARLQLTRLSYTGTDVFACFHKSFLRLGLIQEDTRHLFHTVSAGVVHAAVQGHLREVVPSVAMEWRPYDHGTENEWQSPTAEDGSGPQRLPGGNLSVERDGGESLLRDALRRGCVDDAAHRGEVFFRDPYYHLSACPHPPQRRGVLPRTEEEEKKNGMTVPDEPPRTEGGVGEAPKGEGKEVEDGVAAETPKKKEEEEDDELAILQGSALCTSACPWFLRIPSSPQGTFPRLQLATLYAFPPLTEDTLEDGGGEGGEGGGEGNSAEDLKAVVIRCCWRRSCWTPPLMKPPTPGAITAQHPLHVGAFAYLGVGNTKALCGSARRVGEVEHAPPSSSRMHDETIMEANRDELQATDIKTTKEATVKEEEAEKAEVNMGTPQAMLPESPTTTSSLSLPEAKEGGDAVVPSREATASDGAQEEMRPPTVETKQTESEIEEKKKEEAQQQRADAWSFWLQKHKEKIQRDNPYFASRLTFSHFSAGGGEKNKMGGDTASPSGAGGYQKRPSRLTSVGGAANNIPIFQCSTPLPVRCAT